ncbi:MAG: hypothetical protein JKX76_01950 [Colwellia sp.]|nr:hypothetical protein [Colwellia sp.]
MAETDVIQTQTESLTVKSTFIYSWYIDTSDDDCTEIRAYGLDENLNDTCLIINDFTPYVYLELPPKYNWKTLSITLIAQIKEMTEYYCPTYQIKLVYRTKLYYAHTKTNAKTGKKERKKFPYLFITFESEAYRKKFFWKMNNPIQIPSIGSIKLKIHESNADISLQMRCHTGIDTAGWVNFVGKPVTNKQTICDEEYIVSWKDLSVNDKEEPAPVKIMGMDIEVYSSIPGSFPQSDRPDDVIFQISCVEYRHLEDEDNMIKYLLTIGTPDPVKMAKENITVLSFLSEASLLEGYAEFIRDRKPNVIIGHNIFGFDIPYMIDRAKYCLVSDQFKMHGFYNSPANEKKIKWSSSAYGMQEFNILDVEGINYIDLLPLVKRDYKLSKYSLKAISEYFIGDTKDPLTVKGIFDCWKMYKKHCYRKKEENLNEKQLKLKTSGEKALAIVGKYCVQDSALVIRIFNKLHAWNGLCEMAKVCRVPIFVLYTQGQQIKTFSQVYYVCFGKGIVVEKDGYITSENEKFRGAFVFAPRPGIYDNVVSFDFKSLYPTAIISQNIDYSTLIDEKDPEMSLTPDSECNIIEWEDHEWCGCPKDTAAGQKKPAKVRVMCGDYRYRFLKKSSIMGVLPELLTNLLNARSWVRKHLIAKNKRIIKIIKKVLNSEELDDTDPDKEDDVSDLDFYYDEKIDEKCDNSNDEQLLKYIDELTRANNVYDKRQLALKVSANSAYGGLGVSRGYLPFMPGAMCTTAYGRQSIMLAKEELETPKYKGVVVYGDTDSCYVRFPHITNAPDLWAYCLKLEKEISKLYPPPMFLEFEESIYERMFLLTKKRYMGIECDRFGNTIMKKNNDGVIEPKLSTKGVMLTRRDNSNYVRRVYSESIRMMFNRASFDEVMDHIMDLYKKLCTWQIPKSEYVVTKSVNDIDAYSTSVPPENKKKRRERLLKMNIPYYDCNCTVESNKCNGCIAFKYKTIPGQAQLAERIKARGGLVASGSRIEYVVSMGIGPETRQADKLEDYDYYKQFSEYVHVDYIYYIHATVNCLDDAIRIVFKKDKVLHKLYKFRLLKYKLCQKIAYEGRTQIVFPGQSDTRIPQKSYSERFAQIEAKLQTKRNEIISGETTTPQYTQINKITRYFDPIIFTPPVKWINVQNEDHLTESSQSDVNVWELADKTTIEEIIEEPVQNTGFGVSKKVEDIF